MIGKWKPYNSGGYNPDISASEQLDPTLMPRKKSEPTKEKAKEMLRDGKVHGKKLTKKQKGYFGIIASGKKPKRK